MSGEGFIAPLRGNSIAAHVDMDGPGVDASPCMVNVFPARIWGRMGVRRARRSTDCRSWEPGLRTSPRRAIGEATGILPAHNMVQERRDFALEDGRLRCLAAVAGVEPTPKGIGINATSNEHANSPTVYS